jgi:cytochrome P450
MTRITNDPPLFPLERSCPLDPPDELGRLREQDPVTRMTYPAGPVGWLVTGFAEARAVLADPRFSARHELLLQPTRKTKLYDEPVPPGMFSRTDDPEHARYRKLVTARFTAKRVRAAEPMIERIVDEQLTELAAAGSSADLMSQFAEPVSARITCTIIGFMEADRKLVMRHAATSGAMSTSAEEADRAAGAIILLAQRMLRRKSARPGDDLASDLLATGELSKEEIVALVVTLFAGGMDTTPNALALGILALLNDQGELAKLRAEPARIDDAVDELLRFLTVSHLGATRCALEDVEVGGHVISKGEVVTVALNAANRDPRRFTDPDRLDVHRSDRAHLAFGHGGHLCLGHALARTTLRIAYRALFNRLQGLRLAVAFDDLRMRHDMIHYGVHELPVTWDA